MRYAIISASNIVIDITSAPENWSHPAGLNAVASDTAHIGYIYNGSTFVAPVDTPSEDDLISAAYTCQGRILRIGQTFNVATSGSAAKNILCDGLQSTRSDLSLLALYGQANPSGSKTWIDNDGVATVLSGTELVQLATLAGNWISDTYPTLIKLIGEITASPPTITTKEQIDAFVWPTA